MDLIEIAAKLGIVPEEVEGWGMSTRSNSVVAHPKSQEEVAKIFAFARENQVSVGFRGTGCSYGDASQNGEGILLDLTGFDRIRSFDEESGIIVMEPGVTIEKVWRSVIAKGYWPPVVSGTMYPTYGGLLSMNVHGKNNWKYGTVGEHVISFQFLTIDGEVLTCSHEENPDLFFAAISGFGMLGCFVEITMRLKKIYSGNVEVEGISTPTLEHMACYLDEHRDDFDYLVGWIDCFPRGKRLGRGLIHAARYIGEGEDPNPKAMLDAEAQDLPDRLFGIVPKRWMWRGLKLFMNDFGMRAVNAAKFGLGTRGQTRNKPYQQGHAAFNFLLDYVPDWKKAYLPGGLIQYQSFVPKENATRVHTELLRMCHREGLIPYLGVYKRHRPDPFLLTHAIDGFSFAMDFKVTDQNRERLWYHCHKMDEVVLEAGGRFYFAKDATLQSSSAHRFFPKENLEAFLELKRKLDPDGLLQTNLARRLYPEFAASAVPAESPSA